MLVTGSNVGAVVTLVRSKLISLGDENPYTKRVAGGALATLLAITRAALTGIIGGTGNETGFFGLTTVLAGREGLSAGGDWLINDNVTFSVMLTVRHLESGFTLFAGFGSSSSHGRLSLARNESGGITGGKISACFAATDLTTATSLAAGSGLSIGSSLTLLKSKPTSADAASLTAVTTCVLQGAGTGQTTDAGGVEATTVAAASFDSSAGGPPDVASGGGVHVGLTLGVFETLAFIESMFLTETNEREVVSFLEITFDALGSQIGGVGDAGVSAMVTADGGAVGESAGAVDNSASLPLSKAFSSAATSACGGESDVFSASSARPASLSTSSDGFSSSSSSAGASSSSSETGFSSFSSIKVCY